MKQRNSEPNEVEKLISLIFQGGRIEIRDSQLWVFPVEIAQRFGDQIKRLKPGILIAFGHCPICARELICKIEPDHYGHTMQHLYCSELGHYDSWKP